jgi:hypothetical protein
MSIFGRAFEAVKQVGRGIISGVKEALPGIQSGIKKGVVIGREILDVGKDVYRNLKEIPVVGDKLATADAPIQAGFKLAGDVLDTVDDAERLVDKGVGVVNRALDIGRRVEAGGRKIYDTLRR